ncbi:Sensory transduction protein regX3 [Paenibacillus konkukensis]|uniref:Sensory transduction protein regX3 n=1 Tax=Paenibacillus konkukensis TaxID=2020716 RepID=A0ABY4RQK7_9BACL|nr:winged-helix domain-containing protein [Paenibacillus konkukensis]UQZ83833.1 Sensory transduction protein regX3 [Paenibacillus konkukensis]
MQQQRQINELEPVTAPAMDPALGAYCSTTNTIVIISAFPRGLHELVRELTAKCYDVLVFHHLDEQALSALAVDLLIMDGTHETIQSKPRPSAIKAPAVLLVRGERQDQDPAVVSSFDDTMQWSAEAAGSVLSRIEELLLQPGRTPEERSDQVQRKELVVDFKKMAVYLGQARIDLTKTEFDLLKALLDTGGAVLSRQELMDRVWGDQYFGGSNTVDVHVKSLRQKLKDNPKSPTYIETVRGVGYRLAD